MRRVPLIVPILMGKISLSELLIGIAIAIVISIILLVLYHIF